MKKMTGKTQVNPLGSKDHGTAPSNKVNTVSNHSGTKVDGAKFVKKPLNAHKHQPGFAKYGSTGMKVA